jgi:inosose dehydratase
VIHPHAGGCIEFADEIRQVIEDIPYETAGLCLDTGHLYYSGMEPVAWLRDQASRLDYIHFKDIDLDVYRQVMGERIRFFEACAQGVMCPIGRGIIDYPAIRRLLEAIGYQGCITIEQERDPRNAGGSLGDVKRSLDYLKSVGF